MCSGKYAGWDNHPTFIWYECLPTFCFLCGRIGQRFRDCGSYDSNMIVSELSYRLWLRGGENLASDLIEQVELPLELKEDLDCVMVPSTLLASTIPNSLKPGILPPTPNKHVTPVDERDMEDSRGLAMAKRLKPPMAAAENQLRRSL